MITDAVLDVFAAVFTFVVGLMPTVSQPAWVAGVANTIADAITGLSGLGWWVPLDAIRNVVVLVLLAYATALTIRLVRIVLSLFTGGGGGAA